MTFSIVGTGNIAWFLGQRLVAGRHHCTGVYARDIAEAERLSGAVLSDKTASIEDIRDSEADVCILAVSDSAIGKVAGSLSLRSTMLVHTAGAVSLDALQHAATERAVLWPVYSISKTNLPVHRNIPCAWEASTDKAARYIQSLGHAITDNLFEARYEQRKWLHLGAVMSNNFINHLIAVCEQICVEHGLPFTALEPIIAQTFKKAAHGHAATLQTGPAIRRDSNTIQNHLAMLVKNDRWKKIYEALTDSIQHITIAGNK